MDNTFLIKSKWTKKDLVELESYLQSLSKGAEKAKWEQRIVNTSLKCLAIDSKKVNEIIKQIYKGNYLSFIDLFPFNNYTETIILGSLICKIKDFEQFRQKLNKFANMVDNWGSCDTLKFEVNSSNEKNFFALAKKYIKSPKPFVRRIGIRILFKFVSNDKYLDNIYKILNGFENEKEYYVNMALSWLVCELFIKQRERTMEFLLFHKLNNFVINKSISKCNDSFRVSKKDKLWLKTFRINKQKS